MSKKLSFSIAVNLLTENFRKGANTVKSSLKSIQMQVVTFAAALGLGGLGLSGLITRFKDVARETSRVLTALKNVSNGTRGFADNLRFINDMAKKYGLEVNALTGNFAKFTASATQANMPMEQQQKVFESLSRASTAFGLSAEDTNGVFLALSQMMGKGKISSEELRKQMGERIPIAMQAMAKAAGVSMGQLEKLLQQGKLMSADIIPKFADALNEMIPNVDTDNLETSLNRLSNTFGDIVNASGMQNKYKALIDGLNSLLKSASENIQSIITMLVAAIGFVATRGFTKLWGSYSALASQMEAHTIRTNAQLLNAKQARIAAELQLEKAKNVLLNATDNQKLAAKKMVADAEVALTNAKVAEEKALESTKVASRKAIDAQLLANKQATAKAEAAITTKRIAAELELEEAKFAALIASGNKRLASEQRLAKAQSNLAKLTTQEVAAQEAAKIAAYKASQVIPPRTASLWTRSFNTIKAGAAKLITSLKSMWASFAPAIIISGVIALVMHFKNLYTETKRIKNIFSDYKKEAESIGNTQEVKMLEAQLRIMNDKTKSQKEINDAQSALRKMLGDEKLTQEQINKEVAKRIQLLKETARADFYARKAVETEDQIKGLEAKKQQLSAEEKSHKGVKGAALVRTLLGNDIAGALGMETTKNVQAQIDELKKVAADANANVDQALLEANKLTKDKVVPDPDPDDKSTENRLKAEQWLLSKQRELDNERERNRIDSEQKRLDLEEDSFDKRFKQIKLNHEKELLEIKQFESDKLKEQLEAAKNIYVRKNGSDKGFNFDNFDKSKLPIGLRPEDIRTELIARDTQATSRQEADTTELLRSMIGKYKDYNEQKKAINKQYSDDEATLNALRNAENAKAIDAALTELKKAREKAIKEINDSEAKEYMKSTDLFVELFEDASRKSVSELKSIIDKANELKKVLKDSSAEIPEWFVDSQIKNKGSLNPDQLKQAREAIRAYIEELKKDPKAIKDFEDAIASLYGTMGNVSPVAKFSDSINKAIENIKKGGIKNIGAGIEGIGNATQEIMPHLQKFGDDMRSIFGDGVGDSIDGFLKSVESLSEIGTGTGKLMQGDVTGILDIASGFGKIFGHARKVNKEHREALRLLRLQAEEQKHLYKIEKLREALASESANTIYGSDEWGKAANATKVYHDAVKELDKSLRKLEDVDVVTGSRKSGWGFWKKRKDVWSDLLSAYPKLIDGNGKFDKSLADTILSTQKLSDEGKMAIQQAIENAEVVEEAFSSLKDYLSGLFGDLGQNMMSAFTDAFKGSKSAIADFVDSASGMLGKLVEDFIYNLRLAPIIEKASKEAENMMLNNKLTEDQKNQKLIDITGGLINDILKQQDYVNADLEKWGEIIREQTGNNPFKDKHTQDTTKGYSTSMDQDTGGAILGRVTGLHETGIELKNLVSSINVSIQGISTNNIAVKNELTNQTEILDEMRQVQKKSALDMREMKDTLTVIKTTTAETLDAAKGTQKNTKGLIGK